MAQIEFSEVDFKNCRYIVYEGSDIWGQNPSLKVLYAEVAAMLPKTGELIKWKEFISPEQLMKYVVLCYHKPSPLINTYPEIRERKVNALILSGVDVNSLQKDEEGKKLIANILLSRHEFTTRLALHFCRSENNLVWQEYVHLLDILEDAMFEMNNPNDGEKLSSVEVASKKSTVYKGIQQYRGDLNSLAEKLMQDDKEMQGFMSSQLTFMKRRRLITPEDYVKLTKEELMEVFMQQGVA